MPYNPGGSVIWMKFVEEAIATFPLLQPVWAFWFDHVVSTFTQLLNCARAALCLYLYITASLIFDLCATRVGLLRLSLTTCVLPRNYLISHNQYNCFKVW